MQGINSLMIFCNSNYQRQNKLFPQHVSWKVIPPQSSENVLLQKLAKFLTFPLTPRLSLNIVNAYS